MCFLGKKEFVFETQRDSFLNAQVINAEMKEGDRSAIRMGMKLMKRRLCFRITAKLGNSKRQHYSRQEKKKNYIYKEGSTIQKACEGKERREVGKIGRSFIHI